MQWWNDFLDWFGSDDGQTVFFGAIIPFVAILVAGIVAAAIGRGSTRRLLTLNDREIRAAAVATLIGAARRASVWNTLGAPEQQHADHIASEADVRIRLLGVPGSGLAADWAAHEIAAMKRNSVSFSFQAEQSLIEFRERMVQWQAKPSRAKKLFKNDLDLWSYEDSQATKDIISQQKAWAASQVADETGPSATHSATAGSSPQEQVGTTGRGENTGSSPEDVPAGESRATASEAVGRPSPAPASGVPAAVSISSLGNGSSSSDDRPPLIEPAAPRSGDDRDPGRSPHHSSGDRSDETARSTLA